MYEDPYGQNGDTKDDIPIFSNTITFLLSTLSLYLCQPVELEVYVQHISFNLILNLKIS